MAADEAGKPRAVREFGTCCGELREAMSGNEFEPLIAVAEDGVLYMSVGLIEMEGEEPGMVDHPVFYCPFCGKALQSADDVRAAGGEDGAS